MATFSRLLPTIITAYALQAAFAGVFVPMRTERYYDFCGMLGFLSSLGVSIYGPAMRAKYWDKVPGARLPGFSDLHPRQILLTAAVGIWTIRLGSFLLQRVITNKKDSRFDKVRGNAATFSFFWFMQGEHRCLRDMTVLTCAANWVLLVGMPAYLINTIPKAQQPPLGPRDFSFLALSLASFALEVTADGQKKRWRAAKDAGLHKDKFITSGLWGWSRHPKYDRVHNMQQCPDFCSYVGEVGIWLGLLGVASTALNPRETLLAAASPAMTYMLLRYVSCPALEILRHLRVTGIWSATT